ncbi:hypothetical protein CPB83DRAFT_911799 [Crepidotus variabilis]|uniref:Uncharacterized protein n=1 Tax=Crepidotus variabilis TaxID=179855 RepID=A0A9P6BBB7_9AGAR|nr:hypothetical protein CPB83DRAFT_911799 [Crepidotus variabilis]
MAGYDSTGMLSEDSWIWGFSPGKLSDTELQDWINEGDSVQWFRAEAEMQRWQKQIAIKQAEFLRVISTFFRMSDVWGKLGSLALDPGAIAYAKKKAYMFSEMAATAVEAFSDAGYGDCLEKLESGTGLWELVAADRVLPEKIVSYPKNEESHNPETSGLADDSESDEFDKR